MSALGISEFTKLNGDGDFGAMAANENISQVFLWDLGPVKPLPPERPTPPKGKEGDPEFDLAKIEFREIMEDYDKALRAYGQAKKDFADFEQRYGGPVERNMWSCDANDALARDPTRYILSSRTRGYHHLKNRGLPAGVEPGHGQGEQERREREGDADLMEARRNDPVFGNGGRKN